MPMFGPGVPPAFPRMSIDGAAERVLELSSRPIEELAQESSTSVDGATYYETAPSRVGASDLDRVRSAIRALAAEHGYPVRQLRGRSLQFDQQLTVLLSDQLNILPADAADEGVWSFLTLNVCPDVALWRFPNDANSEGDVREDYERLIGKPRNIFRRAWWRGYVLGTDVSASLLEDESVQIMERPSIGGNLRFARTVARVHLELVGSGRVTRRQDLLREAIKRIRRRMGQISVYALSDDEMLSLVRNSFDEALSSLASDVNEASSPQSAVERLRSLASDRWDLLEPYAVEIEWADMSRLRDKLVPYRDENVTNLALASRIADDLDALIAGWPEYSPEERAVVHAAVAYFLLPEDEVPDDGPNGLDDDDAVVSAAYEALSRVRN